jgi:glutamine amidotransferase
MANDPQRLRCALHPGRALLAEPVPSDNPQETIDGWGVGFYQGGEVLLQRRPKPPAGAIDFMDLLRDLRTDALIGHMRSGTVGAPKNENTHPFRFRSWLFAHHGTIAGFADSPSVRERFIGTIPDFLRRNIRGQTDSEHLFHLFLAGLHAAGKIDDPTLAPRAAAKVLAETIAAAEEIARGHGDSALDVAATNGRILLATRRGRPLFYYRVDGVRDCPVCREAPAAELARGAHSADHEHLRAVVLVADGGRASAPVAPPWQEVPESSVVTVSHELAVEITPL